MAKPRVPRNLTLTLGECQPGALPPVCAKCGAGASGETAVPFRWYQPGQAGLLVVCWPAALAILHYGSRKRDASMPVCPRHAGTWNWGNSVLLFSIAATATFLVAIGVSLTGRHAGNFPAGVFVALKLFIIAGVFGGVALRSRGVYPTALTAVGVELTGLAPAFVEAVVAARER